MITRLSVWYVRYQNEELEENFLSQCIEISLNWLACRVTKIEVRAESIWGSYNSLQVGDMHSSNQVKLFGFNLKYFACS